MSKLNVDLLRRTLDAVKAEAAHKGHHWDQRYWRINIEPRRAPTRCNTAMCFAGWATKLDGGRFMFPSNSEYPEMLIPRKADPKEVLFTLWDERRKANRKAVSVRDRARRVLGLTDVQAINLFQAHNTVSELESIIDRLIQTHEHPEPTPPTQAPTLGDH